VLCCAKFGSFSSRDFSLTNSSQTRCDIACLILFFKGNVMSNSKIYVGNLSYDVTGDDLQEFFTQYGEISECKLITDFEGRSKGFAFITFEAPQGAEAALKADGVELSGRKLRVNMARENNRRGGGTGGGNGGGQRRFSRGNDRDRY